MKSLLVPPLALSPPPTNEAEWIQMPPRGARLPHRRSSITTCLLSPPSEVNDFMRQSSLENAKFVAVAHGAAPLFKALSSPPTPSGSQRPSTITKALKVTSLNGEEGASNHSGESSLPTPSSTDHKGPPVVPPSAGVISADRELSLRTHQFLYIPPPACPKQTLCDTSSETALSPLEVRTPPPTEDTAERSPPPDGMVSVPPQQVECNEDVEELDDAHWL